MRTNLKCFRIRKQLSQQEIADQIGCSRATYTAIECGKRSGRPAFWEDLQKAFELQNADMWDLMINEE